MRILILGGDGYLGWATAMYFSRRGHEIALVDNFLRRRLHLERGTDSLTPIRSLHERVQAWRELTGKHMALYIGDLTDWMFTAHVFREFRPEVVVHYGQMPSAPYSMISVQTATFTHINNVIGNLHVLYAMRDYTPDAHLIKLGTMGEYGQPNIDIEEGYIEIEHKGRKDRLPFPKMPGSMYHLTKVHDSHNIHFACRVWNLRATDLNQGVVYGIDTDESVLDPRLINRFDYDEVFGTALNRFCVQAVIGIPLTVYGSGGQTRGYLNIRDTLACVELTALNPAEPGEFRVFNQFTEQFSVLELAYTVQRAARELGIQVEVGHYENPRVEKEEHYYNAVHTSLLKLGLQPHYLSEELVESMIKRIAQYKDRVIMDAIVPRIRWTCGEQPQKVRLMATEPLQ
ncbi:MAG: NAD-dependent epimerase/dehydratase family protein [Chloroflexi bacterium]|jgi:UDP-sulfoquinovose synthase|nr:NAD-dependent epimerase/dehydratase family protein [Chloroflexota bacterium]